MVNDKREALGKLIRAASFGMLVAAPCIVAGAPSQAWAQVTETILYSFTTYDYGFGLFPALRVESKRGMGAASALYGVGPTEGTGSCGGRGCGNLFKLTAPEAGQMNWPNTVLWNFTGGSDGSVPLSELLPSRKHISRTTPIYGTTSAGNGTVYRLVGNTLTTIYSFTGGADGGYPDGSNVVSDASGALYVALQAEGFPAAGCGTVDKLTPPAPGQTAWTETTIWTFYQLSSDSGCNPTGLVMDKAGVLYGVTEYGGGAPGGYYGNVFRLAPPKNGGTHWTQQNVYNFPSTFYDDNSVYPYSNLTIGKDGALYGTSYGCGEESGCPVGVVFEVRPPKGSKGWTGQTIWNFTGGADGGGPTGSVIIDRNGAVYGATVYGGAPPAEGGTVYKLTPPAPGQSAWTETTLWTGNYDNESLGIAPEGLAADNAGTLYGIFAYGGPTGYGAVFSLTGTGFAP